MSTQSRRNPGYKSLYFLVPLLLLLALTTSTLAEVDYVLDYGDPAGDVLKFNETWSNLGEVETQDQIDIKWLRSSNDTLGNVVLRLEFKSKQLIEVSNETKYVFRIFTKGDNSTGYNITYINGSTTISNFNNTFKEDMTANTSIVDENGEVLVVKVLKSRYLTNITYYNIDAFTWKEQGNKTYVDYVSEIPGHPADTGSVIDQDDGDPKEEEGLLDSLCQLPMIFIYMEKNENIC